MNNLKKIFDILAEYGEYWLPDFSNCSTPINDNNPERLDSESELELYCEWLTDYLSNNELTITAYQTSIIEKLKRKNQLTNAYILANGALSAYYYYFDLNLENFPLDFLENPDPARLKDSHIKDFQRTFDFIMVKSLSAEENLQASLVFAYISKQQIDIQEKNEGPNWLDIGWRPILKEGLETVNNRKDKIEFTKNFIDEFGYMSSK